MSGYGLIEAPIERTAETFGTHRRGDASEMRIAAVTTDASEALEYLSLRTVPATRLVLVDRGDWTAVLTNDRNGSDFHDHRYWAAVSVGVRVIRVVDHDARWWRRGRLRWRLAYAARIFELCARDGQTIRSIACLDDGGRWAFQTFGEPLPIESTFRYDATRKRDRFTSDNLRDLLSAIGPGPLTEESFLAAPRFALLAERLVVDAYRDRVEAAACTLEEADDPAFAAFHFGMGYVPHMRTHAETVIASFERAIKFNPEYEPRVRGHLREARRILGEAE